MVVVLDSPAKHEQARRDKDGAQTHDGKTILGLRFAAILLGQLLTYAVRTRSRNGQTYQRTNAEAQVREADLSGREVVLRLEHCVWESLDV